MTRNIFFSYEDSEPLPIAPCRTITITDDIRREDESKKVQIRITWTPRFSDKTKKQIARPKTKRRYSSRPAPIRTEEERQKRRDRDMKRRKKCLESGLCADCRKTNDTNKTRCTPCQIKHREYARVEQIKRRSKARVNA